MKYTIKELMDMDYEKTEEEKYILYKNGKQFEGKNDNIFYTFYKIKNINKNIYIVYKHNERTDKKRKLGILIDHYLYTNKNLTITIL